MPHPSPRRRFLRYSLRSLLVVITITAIYLGLETHLVTKQRKALEIVAKVGGRAHFDYEYGPQRGRDSEASLPGPTWFRHTVGEDYFRTVVSLSFDKSAITDEDLRQLSNLVPEVRSIWLMETQVTDEGLQHLVKLPKLRALSLDETAITDAGLKYVGQCRQLLDLQLTRTSITDRGLEYLCPIADHLIYIGLSGTQVTDQGVQVLTDCPKCTLRWINLGHTQVTDECLDCFLKRLDPAFINVQSTQVTSLGVDRLKQRFPKCEVINTNTLFSPGRELGSLEKLFIEVRQAIYD